MSEKKSNSNSFSKDQKCIWMESNLVAYKLCEHNYDCENCQFDSVMRNIAVENSNSDETIVKENLIENVISKIEDEKYSDRNIYLENQLILKHLFDNAYYLGINPILINLLDNVKSITLMRSSNYYEREDVIIKIKGDWGEKEFKTPIKFMLMDQINLSTSQLLNKKWFATISITQQNNNLPELTKYEFNKEKQKTITLLTEMENRFPFVGISMNDGGTSVKYLYQYLGKENYKKILEEVFSKSK